MTEGRFQSVIIKKIEDRGGHVINGNYTKAGEADLQCGFPVTTDVVENVQHDWDMGFITNTKTFLVYLAVEVKTDKDYDRIMSGLDEDYNVINDKKLKKHEFVQMAKIRAVRSKGGLAIVAWNFEQIEEYVNENW